MIFLCKYLFQDACLLYRDNQTKTAFNKFTNETSRSKGFVFSTEIRVLGAGPLLALPVQCHGC